jgi:uncharacterized protein
MIKILRKIGIGIAALGYGFVLIGFLFHLIPSSCTLGNILHYEHHVMSYFITYKEWHRVHFLECLYEAKEAANQGDVEKQLYLGKLYYYGHHTVLSGGQGKKNYYESVKWYKLAAEQGNREAISQLVGFYKYMDDGSSIKPSDVPFYIWSSRYEEGIKWLRLAAEQGDNSAQSDLGDAYYEGKGVPQNYKEAVKWWEKSAQEGGYSLFKLVEAYRDGKGVSKNYVMAHMYLNVYISKSSRFDWLEEKKDSLEKEMTPSEIEEAQQLALEWMQTHQ